MTEINKQIRVDKKKREDFMHCMVSDWGKPAYTEVATLAHLSCLPRGENEDGIEASFQKYSLVALKLHTGRTHQIRVHMLSISHPLASV